MSLGPGIRLGPYEIVSPLGAGGMGEVYKARDTRLDRSVALKVLPAEFAADPERRARFEREARAIAALSHPHICTIHDVGRHHETDYLVMELLEGETLADRLGRAKARPVPMNDVLRYAIEIADALDKAHRAGIVHRDLKPANIMLTKSGAKLLDFGLAKLKGPAIPISMTAIEHATTTGGPKTASGTILGTVHYMSPEQVEGREADARSDIWALGVVIYEMATGARPFEGASAASIIGAILKDTPGTISARQPLSPAALDHVVERCLDKDADERWQHAGDVKRELEWIARTPPESRPGAAVSKTPARSRIVEIAALLTIVAAAAGVLVWWTVRQQLGPSATSGIVRVNISLGAPVASTNLGPDAVLSPDGTRLVLVAEGPKGQSRLLTRRVDQSQLAELPGTDGAYAPFVSPNGQWVAFFAGGRLKKTLIDGSSDAVNLCEAPAGRGGTWADDNNIIAALDSQAGLFLIPVNGGSITPLTTLAPGENSHRWPQALPGGRSVIFNSSNTFGNFADGDIRFLSLVDHTLKTVLAHGGMYPRYVSSGHLIYLAKSALFAVPFDASRGELRGQPSALVDDVSNDTTFGFSRVDFSTNGLMLYRPGRNEGLRTFQWLDGAGKLERLDIEPALFLFPRISPDGTKVIWMVNQGPTADLWIYDSTRGTKTRLTDSKTVYSYPVWSPDGRFVVFSATGGVFWTRADGAGQPQLLTPCQALCFPTSFASDGGRLAFSELKGGGGAIQTVRVDGGGGQLRAGAAELFLQTPSALPFPAFSPDGRWIAYADAASGSYEVYVRGFPDRGNRWLISNGGGTMPVWARNGRELFYRTEDGRIMAATYSIDGETFVSDKPRVWSVAKLANTGLTPNFDLAPDGKRAVVLMPAERPAPADSESHAILVMNLPNELRRTATVQDQ